MSLTTTLTEPLEVAVNPQMPKAVHALPEEEPNVHQGIALESLGGPDPGAGEEGIELTNASRLQQRWNNPKSNTWKIAAAYLALFNSGANDASYGALIPFLGPYYNVDYTIVSLVFLAPFLGYTLAAFTCNRVHVLLGQRGVGFVGALCRLVAYVVIAVHPPYPVIIVFYIFVGYGLGLIDAAWNAWVGDLVSANQLLGLLHGFYGLGATVSPLVLTAMVTRSGFQWYTFFYIMVSLLVLEMATSVWAFWSETAVEYRRKNTQAAAGPQTRAALRQRATLITAAFLLVYVGTEVSIGGWVITFMTRIRHGRPFQSGLTATGFWLGITCGRVVLGFVTPIFGERISVSIYLALAVGFELIFWLVPNFISSAVAVGFVGFFLGPMFPAAVIVVTKLLPKQMHVSALGFATGLGGVGSGALPFAVGAIAQARGVQTLQPIALAFIAVMLGLWLTLPKIPKHQHQS